VDARCRIELFGALRLVQQDRTLTRFRTHKAAHLLAYLALHRDQSHARERLIELFWPEMQTGAGRDNLSTALSSLRRQIEPAGVPAGSVLVADRQNVRLNPVAVTTDVAEFEQLTTAAARARADAARISLLERAIGLYRGELLPGCYEEWALQEQTRTAGHYADALQAWAAALERVGHRQAALDAASRALAADPFREELYRLQMRLLAALGRVGAAQETYRTLESLFQAELGVSPSAATRSLAERLHREPQDLMGTGPETASSPTKAADPEPKAPLPAPDISPATGSLWATPSLPLQLTRFFGRGTEMEHLERLLRDERVRLITLTGMGGSGKTRLAIETAGQVADAFAGRVWFVDLAGVPAPHLIPFALSQALKLPPDPGADPAQRVIQALGEAPCLLVLDNFEHLLGGLGGANATGLPNDAGTPTKRDHPGGDGTALVRLLLERVPGLTCLVTSRQPLHLGGEREFPVTPLPVPVPVDSPSTAAQVTTPERLLQLASVALYADRAQAVRPDFAVTPANAEAVARLCHKLEGMPLAIEMAAAWAKTLSPAAMLERLERQLSLLISRRRDLPPRHQSLRATIEWSYALLPTDLQRAFARLSVFRGGWTLASVEAVCGRGALVWVSDLAERSLLVWEEPASEEPGAGARYRLLEPLREFAQEKLSESGEEERVRQAHVAYFLALAEEARSHYKGPDEALWLNRLEREVENLRAALQWCWDSCEQTGHPTGAEVAEMLLRLATALDRFWQVRGYATERCHWLEGSLSKAPERTEARAWALCAAGRLARGLGDPERAQRRLDESLSIMREQGNQRGIAEVLMGLGMVASHHGDFEAARTLHEESLAIVRALDNKPSIAESLYLLGSLARSRGDLDQASALWEESRAMDQAAGVRAGYVLIALAHLARERGEYGEAARLLGIRLRETHEIGEEIILGDLMRQIAEMALAMGQPERAARLGGASATQKEALARRTGIPPVRAKMFDDFADAVRVALGEGAFAAAWAEGQAMTLERAIAEACEGALEEAPR
jgi:predicted ATPase/DNA-binding SARP family transcriptional activator